ncbi:MAG: hypothetical protein PVG39_02135 [Desulfobacteraceae bacterium]|jgi:hypothetical protein
MLDVGNRFGRLVVRSYHHRNERRQAYYLCVCDCGKESIVKEDNLKRGYTKSCGCYRREFNSLKQREKHHRWKGGRRINSNGYIQIRIPDHHRAHPDGYVLEHIVLAEKALGKPLPQKAQVHHFGKKTDNTKLVICENQTYHQLLHKKARRASLE